MVTNITFISGFIGDVCKMKRYLFLLLVLLSMPSLRGQISGWNVRLEEKTLSAWSGAQSFSAAAWNNQMLVVGGRSAGLHQRHPFAAFLVSEANASIHVIDPANLTHWALPVDSLPIAVQDQFLSTNMQSVQQDSMLYLMGGYGYMNSLAMHSTHGRITAIHVPQMIAAIQQGNGAAARAAVRTWADPRFAWTGGVARELNGQVFLAGGQFFHGSYNPMGPNHGPGFSQNYHDGYVHFSLIDDGDSLAVMNFTFVTDSALMHRRDYNMTHTMDPSTGALRLTAFSGVFQPGANLPWHDMVDLSPAGLSLRIGASQLLNQYHSAHFGLWDSVNSTFSTVFLGGIGEYLVQSDGSLIQDPNVPFTKHISAIVETPNGSSEYYLGDMPDFLGAGAEFFPIHSAMQHGIISTAELPTLPNATVLIGYMVGGIRSTGPNIFFSNGSNLSTSNDKIFEVWLDASGIGVPSEVLVQNWAQFDQAGQLRLGGRDLSASDVCAYDSSGRIVYHGALWANVEGYTLPESLTWEPGAYTLRFDSGESLRAVK